MSGYYNLAQLGLISGVGLLYTGWLPVRHTNNVMKNTVIAYLRLRWYELHLREFQRVLFPLKPVNAFFGYTVDAVQMAIITGAEPPGTIVRHRTILVWILVVVLVFGAELHAKRPKQ